MSKAGTVNLTLTWAVEECCWKGCGMCFAVPTRWQKDRLRLHDHFYCPNGHEQWYSGPTEEEKLKKDLATANGNLKFLQERLTSEKGYSASLERSRAALRGVATRLRAKGKIGECLFCHQHFNDLALHVAEKHPEVDPEKIDEDAATEAGRGV